MSCGLSAVFDDREEIRVEQLSALLQVPEEHLAASIGVEIADLDAPPTERDLNTNHRLRALVEVLVMTTAWAGSVEMAWAHYRTYPIASLGQLTAQEVLASGRVEELFCYLKHIEQGGYA